MLTLFWHYQQSGAIFDPGPNPHPMGPVTCCDIRYTIHELMTNKGTYLSILM